MLSLRLVTANRFVGILFIASIGILVTLLTLTYLESHTTTVIMESSTNVETYPATWVSGPSFVVAGPVTIFPVQDINELRNQPFQNVAEIAAGVTILLGILYLVLKQLNRQVSEEIFP